MNLVFLCRLKLPNKPQIPANRVVYIENTAMFVQIAEGLWIPSILHTDYRPTCAKLASFGLQNGEGVMHATR
jgi:putative hydrolase of the HAD superfamily